MSENTTAQRPLRADAARNRRRVLESAAELFADRGIDVTLDEIARHAGLGVGTVYRRFPDREALVEALFEQRMDEQVVRMRAAVEDPDPWRGLTELITDMCEELAEDRGMRQMMLSSEYGVNRVAALRAQIYPLVAELVARTHAAGGLRENFAASDLLMLLLMIAAVADFAGDQTPNLWRRYLALFVDGMRSGTRPPPMQVPDPLDDHQLAAAMSRWRPARNA